MADDPADAADVSDSQRRSGGLLNLFRSFSGRSGDSSIRDTFEELLEEHEERETPIDPNERTLIANILKFGEMTAYDVMVPRADIVGVEVDTPLAELVRIVVRQPHSRYPVYREMLDDTLGMVHIKDVLAAYADSGQAATDDPFDLRSIMREVMVIAPSMRVLDLLLQMRLSRTHMALVVDEYGGIDGLVTIEDLVEEIVGEIEDEHDVAERPRIQECGDGSYAIDARLPLEELEERFGPILTAEERDEDIDTVGGYVFTIAGRVPSRGELIRHPETALEVEVVEVDPRRIKLVRLRNLPRPPGEADHRAEPDGESSEDASPAPDADAAR